MNIPFATPEIVELLPEALGICRLLIPSHDAAPACAEAREEKKHQNHNRKEKKSEGMSFCAHGGPLLNKFLNFMSDSSA
jgi:hypothetical protein